MRILRRPREARALNAFVLETPERAREMAARADAALARGEGGPLAGVPLGVKDMFCTADVRTTACSRILDNFVPTYESTVTANLWRDGAVLLGKLNNDEFAMGSSNETSRCRPGGVAVAAPRLGREARPGRFVRRLGGRGGGRALPRARSAPTPAARSASRRRSPASSASSRPTAAARAAASSPMRPRSIRPARSRAPCATAAILLRSMAGLDPKDTTSVDVAVPDYEAALARSVKGMKIGIPREYRVEGMSGEIEALWRSGAEWLESAGAEIVEVSLPHTRYALPAYYIVAPAEASSNLARYDGVRYGLRAPARDIIDMYEETRAAGFGPEVRRRIMIGTYVLSAGYYDAYYLRAQKVRTPDQARLRRLLSFRRRRDPDADHAVGGLRHRRAGQRPGRDVSQRHLHRDGEHGRACPAFRCPAGSTPPACRSACS